MSEIADKVKDKLKDAKDTVVGYKDNLKNAKDKLMLKRWDMIH